MGPNEVFQGKVRPKSSFRAKIRSSKPKLGPNEVVQDKVRQKFVSEAQDPYA